MNALTVVVLLVLAFGLGIVTILYKRQRDEAAAKTLRSVEAEKDRSKALAIVEAKRTEEMPDATVAEDLDAALDRRAGRPVAKRPG